MATVRSFGQALQCINLTGEHSSTAAATHLASDRVLRKSVRSLQGSLTFRSKTCPQDGSVSPRCKARLSWKGPNSTVQSAQVLPRFCALVRCFETTCSYLNARASE